MSTAVAQGAMTCAKAGEEWSLECVLKPEKFDVSVRAASWDAPPLRALAWIDSPRSARSQETSTLIFLEVAGEWLPGAALLLSPDRPKNLKTLKTGTSALPAQLSSSFVASWDSSSRTSRSPRSLEKLSPVRCHSRKTTPWLVFPLG